MRKKIKYIKYLPLAPLCLALLLPGCAVLALSALGAGAGVGIPYVVADCADRTLNYPYDQIYKATPEVLQKMDIALLEKVPTKRGEKIRALAHELDITINMEILTASATRVTVNATKNSLVKDKATAEEILNQLERILARKKEPEARRVFENSPPSFDASNKSPSHHLLESSFGWPPP